MQAMQKLASLATLAAYIQGLAEVQDNFWRNGFALGLVVGSCTCAALLVTVSAMPISESNSTTDWLVSISSILSVLISSIAVFLVAGTLKVTEETLSETKKIGVAQTRAWLLVKSVLVEKNQNNGSVDFEVTFHNFGVSPASDVKTEIHAYTEPYPFAARPLERLTPDYRISILPPGVDFRRFISIQPALPATNWKTRLRIRFSYRLLDNSEVEAFSEWILMDEKQGFFARPSMPVDSANYQSPLNR